MSSKVFIIGEVFHSPNKKKGGHKNEKRIISLLTVLVMTFSLSAVTYAEVPTASAGSGTYRVKAVCKVYSGSASESITVYSTEKKV